MNNILKNKKGTSILLVILILTSILTIVLGVSDLVLSGIKMGKIQSQSTKAFFASEAGIEEVLWEVRKNNFDITESVSPSGDLDDSSYEVVYSGEGETASFLSLGNNSGVRRSIEVSFNISGSPGG